MDEHTFHRNRLGRSQDSGRTGTRAQQPPEKGHNGLSRLLGRGGLAFVALVAAVGASGCLPQLGSGSGREESTSQPATRPTQTQPAGPQYAGPPFNPCTAMQQTAMEVVGPGAEQDPYQNDQPGFREQNCSWTGSSTELKVSLSVYSGNDAIRQANQGAEMDNAEAVRRLPDFGDEAHVGKIEKNDRPKAVVKVRASNLVIEINYAKTSIVSERSTPYPQLRETAVKVAKKALLKSE